MLVLYLVLGCTCLIFRLAYIFVPIYDIYCQIGTPSYLSLPSLKVTEQQLFHNGEIEIEINFEAENNNGFTFKPHVKTITTLLGKPTLAFYTIKNLGTEPLQGIRTYNVTPRKAAPFFYKLECFCFDEQRIKPSETLELPILFYISPEIVNCEHVSNLTINYVFHFI